MVYYFILFYFIIIREHVLPRVVWRGARSSKRGFDSSSHILYWHSGFGAARMLCGGEFESSFARPARWRRVRTLLLIPRSARTLLLIPRSARARVLNDRSNRRHKSCTGTVPKEGPKSSPRTCTGGFEPDTTRRHAELKPLCQYRCLGVVYFLLIKHPRTSTARS